MLGRLFKHEFKATGRHFLFMYIVFFVITLFNKLFLETSVPNNHFLSYFRNLIMTIYVITCAAIFVITAVLIVNRFYKNLMCDEGYLMFTLPVTVNQHIIVKTIVSFIWTLLSIIIFITSIFILVCGHGLGKFLSDLIEFIWDMFQYYNEQFFLFLTISVITCITGIIFSILQAYLSIAIGQLVNKHRVMTSFAAYFAINLAVQTVSTFALFFVDTHNIDHLFLDSKSKAISFLFQFVNTSGIISIILSIVLSIMFFFATSFILNRKLNLE